MIHINLNMIFYTHVEHSPTKTSYIKYYKIPWPCCLYCSEHWATEKHFITFLHYCQCHDYYFDRIKLLTCTPQNSQGLNGSLLQNLISWVQVHGGEDQYVDTHHKTLMTNQICNTTCTCYRHAFQVRWCEEGQEGGRRRGGRGGVWYWAYSSVWQIRDCTPENSGSKLTCMNYY